MRYRSRPWSSWSARPPSVTAVELLLRKALRSVSGDHRWAQSIQSAASAAGSQRNQRIASLLQRDDAGQRRKRYCDAGCQRVAVQLAGVQGLAAHEHLHSGRRQLRDQPKVRVDRKSTRLNSSPLMRISYAVFCLKKKKEQHTNNTNITTQQHKQKHES